MVVVVVVVAAAVVWRASGGVVGERGIGCDFGGGAGDVSARCGELGTDGM